MTILIAPDSFKHSLTALEAATVMEKAVKSVLPKAQVILHPLADGGEGTVEAVIRAAGGKIVEVRAHDPLMRPLKTSFGFLPKKKVAIIEMAAASGIELLRPEERNPLRTSTYGTGELVRAALDLNVREIIIGVGGSATVDGGMGAIQALGGRFTDAGGNELTPEGRELSRLARIDLSTLDRRLKKVTIRVACDVENPLTGTEGAARVYGPQKGATPGMVEILEKNLQHFAEVLKRDSGQDIRDLPCSGAAGGLGGGLMGMLDAKAEGGFQIIRKLTGLDVLLGKADLVLTGEGKMDDQDFFGKAPFALAKLAKKRHIPVIAFTGSFETEKPDKWADYFTGIFPVVSSPISLDEALKRARENLYRTVKEVIRVYTTSVTNR
ncbi:MAG: glycerate kinase [Chlorobi bacterium]|nr:glycerate kinase [Chlorobiota bacterium]